MGFIFNNIVKSIRKDWGENDKKRDSRLVIPEGIKTFYNISYGPHGTGNLLDIYMSEDTDKLKPTIVCIHGGAWVYGSKEINKYYCLSLIEYGFNVVNINYRLAPEFHFPAPLEDVNMAMNFIVEKGSEYYIDKDKLFFVGDSAGAQIASHYLAILTNKDFANSYDFNTPDISVLAAGLNCGTYNSAEMVKENNDMFMGYIGVKKKKISPELINKVDVYSHITSEYTPSYIMSTYTDFLLPEAQPFYDLLQSHGVQSVIKIYGAPDRQDLGHVFHVNCNIPEAKTVNSEECEFFKSFL